MNCTFCGRPTNASPICEQCVQRMYKGEYPGMLQPKSVERPVETDPVTSFYRPEDLTPDFCLDQMLKALAEERDAHRRAYHWEQKFRRAREVVADVTNGSL